MPKPCIPALYKRYELGNATEQTFRSDLQRHLNTLVLDVQTINEPKRQIYGAPQYVLMQKDIPIGYIGVELRQIHLLESPTVVEFITSYPKEGENTITRKLFKTSLGFVLDKENPAIGKVYINDTQYFDKISLIAWEFCLGGYHLVQKCLKVRKCRTLSFKNLLYHQKIVIYD